MTPRAPALYVPAIAPFAADLPADTARFVAHARAPLAAWAHRLAPFGTTGEAISPSLAERLAALEALTGAGIPAARLIPGTGCCAAADPVARSAHATERSFDAAPRARPVGARIIDASPPINERRRPC